MIIAVWLDKDYSPQMGGSFSYYDRLVKSIDDNSFDKSLDLCFVSENNKPDFRLLKNVISLKFEYNESLLDKIKIACPFVGKIFRKRLKRKIQRLKSEKYTSILKENKVKFIYYLRQSECALPDFPFVATNWDIGHLSTFAFPELISNGEFERRSYFYNNILPKALFVFVESEAGKQELIKHTQIDESKIKIVPIFAGNCVTLKVPEKEQVEILKKYKLIENEFFFYPAQFWAHKNHYGLLQAFKLFIETNPNFKLVLTGSDKGNLSYLKDLTKQLKIETNVLFLGFVNLKDINTFYLKSTALVMASFFGPTNMPPIEAMELGCPIICSDVAGHREILGDAAIYFNTSNYTEIYQSMLDIVKNRNEYQGKIINQNHKSKFKVDYSLNKIEEFLIEATLIRNTWE